ncbi:hypothetical protein HYC85_005011 [Camellia sinensis]|uniref:Uncharacterized protein n=1 Tax=Camellia sinensis TaxID=4442 RepID=A0A7J7I033_CAMSI|nr:hypothetical protein HYC85_005011 [Camellia sinensis]
MSLVRGSPSVVVSLLAFGFFTCLNVHIFTSLSSMGFSGSLSPKIGALNTLQTLHGWLLGYFPVRLDISAAAAVQTFIPLSSLSSLPSSALRIFWVSCARVGEGGCANM